MYDKIKAIIILFFYSYTLHPIPEPMHVSSAMTKNTNDKSNTCQDWI